jgi:peptidyl-prolyl cis-trans isomerase A (cyclophilin A)
MTIQPRSRYSIHSILSLALAVSMSGGCAAQGTQANQSPAGTTPVPGVAATQTQATEEAHPALTNASLANEKAPDEFRVKFVTTKGDFEVEVFRAWSPNGADRFYNLVKIGFFKDIAIFRAIKGFMFQFGIHGTPAVAAEWGEANIKDDPMVGKSNLPYTLCFAKTGAPHSRSSQMFINLGNNAGLDGQGFTPFGKVVEGKDVVDMINTQYGENVGNVQGEFKEGGNAYIQAKFPRIDMIKSVTLIEE